MLPVETFANERELHTANLSRYHQNNATLNNIIRQNDIGQSAEYMNRIPVIESRPRYMGNKLSNIKVSAKAVSDDINNIINNINNVIHHNSVINGLSYLHIVGGTYTASVRLRTSAPASCFPPS